MENEKNKAIQDTPTLSKGYPKIVQWWLWLGLLMIFVQVVVGGITRLTGSGLSITKWEIVTGTLPPLSAAAWEEAFDLYKATPQYAKINEGMSMGQFKFIYFWEYIHRLWARTMGFVFIIPFAIFAIRGYFDRPLLRDLGITFFLAVLVASFGWIMVASGLIDRPWVNAYKLTMHLSLALILFGYLLWTTLKASQPLTRDGLPLLRKMTLVILLLLSTQIVLGGVVSGMRAALFYPTWPDMNGELIPGIVFDGAAWTAENFVKYDQTPFMSALIQTLHRFTGYAVFFLGMFHLWQLRGLQLSTRYRQASRLFGALLVVQVLLGIFTLLGSVGTIPVTLGVLHQAGALLLLAVVLYMRYQTRGE